MENFDYLKWIRDNRAGPYSKDPSVNNCILKESYRVNEDEEDDEGGFFSASDKFMGKYNKQKQTDTAKEPFIDKQFNPSLVDLSKLDAAIQSEYPGAERGEYPFDDSEDSESFFIGDVKSRGTFIAWYDFQYESTSVGDNDEDEDEISDSLQYKTVGLAVIHMKDEGICVYEIQGNGETTDAYGEPNKYIHAYDSGSYKISGLPDTTWRTRLNEKQYAIYEALVPPAIEKK